MRTISTAESNILTATGGRRELIRVQVKDGGGTFRDLTTYPTVNLVNSAAWREDVDSNGLTAEVALKREVQSISIAPLMQDSPLNRAWVPTNSYSALVALKRELKIERAIVPDGHTPSSGDWVLAFHGYVDRIEDSGEEVRVSCRDLVAQLMDTWIEHERVYAHATGVNATGGCRIFEPSTAYSLNEFVIPSEANRNGHFYKVTTAGTTASTEPTWGTSGGGTTSSGSVVFTEQGSTTTSSGTDVEDVIQQLLNDNLGSGVVTLTTPVSPGWAIKWYKQQREPLWDAIRTLVNQLGWDIRFLWDSGSSSFKLTLTEPDRAKASPDRTFSASDYFDVSRLSLDITGIRNKVKVVYSDSGDLDSSGNPKRKSVTATDSTSVTAYGTRFMEVQESSSSNIDSSTEATVFAENIRDDLSQPEAEAQVELPFFPWVELGDLYRYSANGVHFSANTDLAVVGYEHSVDRDKARTTVTCRGTPSGGFGRWLSLAGEVKKEDVHQTTLGNSGGATLSIEPIPGGATAFIDIAESKHAIRTNFELHVSTSSSFTPSTSTLAYAGAARQVALPDLIPGKTYYSKVIPYGFNASRIVRGLPSVETSFTAGRAAAGHLNPYLNLTTLPLNSDFATQTDPDSPPDHWSVASGTAWDTNAILQTDSNGISGENYMKFTTTDAVNDAGLWSGYFPVSPGFAQVSMWRKCSAGSGDNLGAAVYFYSYSLTSGPSSVTAILVSLTDNVDTWVKNCGTVEVPTGAKFARIFVGIGLGASGRTAYVDSVEFRPMLLQGAPTAITYNVSNNWTDYGGSTGAGEYWMDSQGVVHVQGCIARSSGTPSSAETIATLPSGYRPAYTRGFPVITDTGVGQVDIDSSGNLKWYSGGHTYLYLDGISFRTD